MKTAVFLLAAGMSRRFGAQDKLLADLKGKPLVSYAARAIEGLSDASLFAVIRSGAVAHNLPGFTHVKVPVESQSMSESIRAGLRTTEHLSIDAILIVLADMPYITTEDLEAVVSKAKTFGAGAAKAGKIRMPPACFSKQYFERLSFLEGDQGAKPLLQDLPDAALVELRGASWRDIDTVDHMRIAQSEL